MCIVCVWCVLLLVRGKGGVLFCCWWCRGPFFCCCCGVCASFLLFAVLVRGGLTKRKHLPAPAAKNKVSLPAATATHHPPAAKEKKHPPASTAKTTHPRSNSKKTATARKEVTLVNVTLGSQGFASCYWVNCWDSVVSMPGHGRDPSGSWSQSPDAFVRRSAPFRPKR